MFSLTSPGNVDQISSNIISLASARPNAISPTQLPKHFHRSLEAFVQAPSSFAASSLMSAVWKNGLNIDIAFGEILPSTLLLLLLINSLDIYKRLHNCPGELDTVVFNSLINTCRKTSNSERALSLLDDMTRFGVRLDEVTFGSLTAISSETKNLNVARKLLKISDI